MDDLDDYDSDAIDDVGDIGLPPPKETQTRSLTQIARLQVRLILDCTDLDPETWVRIYAARFREILSQDPSLTESQVKHRLYLQKYLN